MTQAQTYQDLEAEYTASKNTKPRPQTVLPITSPDHLKKLISLHRDRSYRIDGDSFILTTNPDAPA